MTQNHSIVELINSAFSDDELRSLCFDHFISVNDDFTVGMTKTQMVRRLLEYCISRGKDKQLELINILHRERPHLGINEDSLMIWVRESHISQDVWGVWLTHPNYKQLIGRDALVEDVCNHLGQAGQPERQGVILHGPSGVGKTSIAIEAVNRFRDSARFDIIIPHQVRDSRTDNALNDLIDSISQALMLSRDGGGQYRVVLDTLEKRRALIFIDNVEYDKMEQMAAFIKGIPRPSCVLLTMSNESLEGMQPPPSFVKIRVAAIQPEYAHQFLLERGVPINEESAREIHKYIQGNAVGLVECASAIQRDGLVETLNALKSLEGSLGETIADQLISRSIEALSKQACLLDVLKTLAIFKESAHHKTLAMIIEPDRERRRAMHDFDKALKILVSGDQVTHEAEHRYRLSEHYYRYIRQSLKAEDLRCAMLETDSDVGLNAWRNRWVDYYCGLRSRSDNWNDDAGWTIYSDYPSTAQGRIDYSQAHEVRTIVDAIRYCLSDKRSATHWLKAAQLLDDFRATLFAAGYWQRRIDFCEAVIGHAERASYWHIYGQAERLLAWMWCFRDDYEIAKEHAKRAHEIALEHIRRSSFHSIDSSAHPNELRVHIVHQQTYYKSLVAFGQIALREGRLAAIKGQSASRAQQEVEARQHFREAKHHFEQATGYFDGAYWYVAATFPDEQLIIDFQKAEVRYYDRHSLELGSEEYLKIESLFSSCDIFEKILERAQKRHIDGRNRPHQRMIAHSSICSKREGCDYEMVQEAPRFSSEAR